MQRSDRGRGEDPLCAITAAILAHPSFDEAACTYMARLIEWRRRLGLFNRIGSSPIATFSRALMLEPRFAAHLIYNFDTHAQANGVTGLGEAIGPDGGRGRLELGFRASRSDGAGLDISGSYDGSGSNIFQSLSGRATVRVPLH